ncbi:hypothetical protein BDF20DRAFT_827121 [Mycotypha africana]|uniref:uncharacterized protein n=1 Tax=Mycotypha africana TaxID=64632 RepID=UPI0023006590|nr:uncharacterized protein BDF20DRAFT_827121 [Mycotypha africana]KAI8969322.1 hypothetical protein BDF20DRAFT_827121 [Mycotypha africana]
MEETLGIGGLSIEAQKEIAEYQAQAAVASLQNATNRLLAEQRVSDSILYVGQLDDEVDDEMLRQHFPTAKNAHVCCDHITGDSLGYGYITFYTTEECDDAFRKMNYSLINGRPCRLMISEHDSTKRTKCNGNIVVKNLPAIVDGKSLHDTFAQWGNVISCRVIKSPNAIRCYGYVNYDSMNAANRAIEYANGALLFGREIQVSHQIPKTEREVLLDDQQQNASFINKTRSANIYVKNIATDVTEDDLKDLFSSFGNISSILIQKDENNMSKGFGFVNFDSPTDAEKAVNQLHDFEYHGKKLFVTKAQKKSEREDELKRQHDTQPRIADNKPTKYHGINLYVKNLPDDVDDEYLRKEFEPFGQITSAKVMRDEKSNSRGFGFVCFASPEDANEAVSKMNGHKMLNREIYVALAQRKEDRRTLLEAQLNQRNGYHSTSMNPLKQRKQSSTESQNHFPPASSISSTDTSTTTSLSESQLQVPLTFEEKSYEA